MTIGTPPTFIPLMWPGKAMVFPAQAGIHVPGPWIPARGPE